MAGLVAKTMSLRLPDDQASELEAIARIDEMPVAEAVRLAIDERIQARRADKTFQERLQRILEEDREILTRLAK